MPNFMHAGTKNAKRTVIGGEGFDKLSHTSSDRWTTFYENNFKPRFSGVQSGLNTSDARPDDEHAGEGRYTLYRNFF